MLVAVTGAALGYAHGHPAHAAAHPATARAAKGHAAVTRVVTPAAAKAVAYAKSQLGKPYKWGGTGPGSFDCSGLVMQAWASVQVSIERTSQQQWATLPHVPAGQVRAGDLVFFAGSDGTAADPGHVGIVVDPARQLMVNAYSAGDPVEYAGYGSAAAPGTGLGSVVGFARPGGAS